MLPVVVAVLVAQPCFKPETAFLQPLEPHVAPAVTDDFGVGRHRVVGEHDPGPGNIVAEQAAAHVVNVVSVAVVGRGHADHRFELRRLPGGDLQAVEPAPGDADHADVAVAPFLIGHPAQDFLAVSQFLLKVFVGQDTFRVAAAPDIDPQGRIAVSGIVVVVTGVAQPGKVALAIGDVLQDARDRLLPAAAGEPEPTGQAGSVRHRDPDVLNGFDFAGEGFDVFHSVLRIV